MPSLPSLPTPSLSKAGKSTYPQERYDTGGVFKPLLGFPYHYVVMATSGYIPCNYLFIPSQLPISIRGPISIASTSHRIHKALGIHLPCRQILECLVGRFQLRRYARAVPVPTYHSAIMFFLVLYLQPSFGP
jgi:hypothetical protein